MVGRRVLRAWHSQLARQGAANAELPPGRLDAAHGFGGELLRLLEQRGRQLGLSLRRLHRAARVARTIADLDDSPSVRPRHVDEALFHRPMEAVP